MQGINALSEELVKTFADLNLMIATAESCTGGLISGAITDVDGSSAVFDRGFTTYSNAAKIDMLGVPASLIEKHGAVSEEVARYMAAGALSRSNADITVAVTGVAGPGGGTTQKPIGLVYIAVQYRGRSVVVSKEMFGDIGRAEIRQATVFRALSMALAQATP